MFYKLTSNRQFDDRNFKNTLILESESRISAIVISNDCYNDNNNNETKINKIILNNNKMRN